MGRRGYDEDDDEEEEDRYSFVQKDTSLHQEWFEHEEDMTFRLVHQKYSVIWRESDGQSNPKKYL